MTTYPIWIKDRISEDESTLSPTPYCRLKSRGYVLLYIMVF
jgi:hypothetical protein